MYAFPFRTPMVTNVERRTSVRIRGKRQSESQNITSDVIEEPVVTDIAQRQLLPRKAAKTKEIPVQHVDTSLLADELEEVQEEHAIVHAKKLGRTYGKRFERKVPQKVHEMKVPQKAQECNGGDKRDLVKANVGKLESKPEEVQIDVERDVVHKAALKDVQMDVGIEVPKDVQTDVQIEVPKVVQKAVNTHQLSGRSIPLRKLRHNTNPDIHLSPGGTTEYVAVADIDTDPYYNDEEIVVVDALPEEFVNIPQPPPPRSHNCEGGREPEDPNFDQKQVCCGVCGEIVEYENLMAHHLPEQHPEIMTGYESVDFEEVPYTDWLKEKLDKKNKEGNRHLEYNGQPGGSRRMDMSGYGSGRPHIMGERVLRKVSQVRVNPNEMTIAQLEVALKKKMVEKMGRKVPVTLVDKQHAKCGVCQAIVSLNKKFEIVHLVRHFNAWHPSAHRCAGSWPGAKCNSQSSVAPGSAKPLSTVDFAIVDSTINATESLQCIWCGMVMDTSVLAMHFYEVHPSDVEVPRCHLCLLELIVNARLSERFNGQDFNVTLPDEYHYYCAKFDTKYVTEKALERGIAAKVKRIETGKEPAEEPDKDEEIKPEDVHSNKIAPVPESFSNSRMALGRRSKPKRHFVQPALRQAPPKNSKFIEVLTDCHWKCTICKGSIMAAVISAGAIRHFRANHPDSLDELQVELCKARLEKVSDGCMDFLNPSLIECRACQMTYPLHKPYNMCRAIRHLKAKHPDYMPEYCNDNATEIKGIANETAIIEDELNAEDEAEYILPSHQVSDRMGEFVTDPETLAELRLKYGVAFDRVQAVYNEDGERIYILMTDDQELDESTIENLARGNNSVPKRSVYDEEELFEEEHHEGDDTHHQEMETALNDLNIERRRMEAMNPSEVEHRNLQELVNELEYEEDISGLNNLDEYEEVKEGDPLEEIDIEGEEVVDIDDFEEVPELIVKEIKVAPTNNNSTPSRVLRNRTVSFAPPPDYEANLAPSTRLPKSDRAIHAIVNTITTRRQTEELTNKEEASLVSEQKEYDVVKNSPQLGTSNNNTESVPQNRLYRNVTRPLRKPLVTVKNPAHEIVSSKSASNIPRQTNLARYPNIIPRAGPTTKPTVSNRTRSHKERVLSPRKSNKDSSKDLDYEIDIGSTADSSALPIRKSTRRIIKRKLSISPPPPTKHSKKTTIPQEPLIPVEDIDVE
uniref:C2H2-type domain-containing protein n=1 Tax=Rhabditophanes sp. KR3021 TaxID=114890 RepID=A0AC35U573_9BILA